MNEIVPLLGVLPPPLAGEGWGGGDLAQASPHAPSLSFPPQAGEGTLEPHARRGRVVS